MVVMVVLGLQEQHPRLVAAVLTQRLGPSAQALLCCAVRSQVILGNPCLSSAEVSVQSDYGAKDLQTS